MTTEQKFKQLAAAMMRVSQLCHELKIPELISLDDQRTVLNAMDAAVAKHFYEFIESLGPKPLTEKVQ